MAKGEALAVDGTFLQGVLLGRKKRALTRKLVVEGGYLLLTSPLQYRLALEMVEKRLIQRGLDPEGFLALAESFLKDFFAVYKPSREALKDAERRGFKPGKDAELAALAIELSIPVVTNDRDFWGRGVATWLPEHLEAYLSTSPPGSGTR